MLVTQYISQSVRIKFMCVCMCIHMYVFKCACMWTEPSSTVSVCVLPKNIKMIYDGLCALCSYIGIRIMMATSSRNTHIIIMMIVP